MVSVLKSRLPIRKVTVFVDWDTARRVVPHDIRRGRQGFEARAIELLQNAVSNFLNNKYDKAAFRVHFRLYHGWFSGKTPTEDRKKIEKVGDDGTQRTIGSVSFSPGFSYSDQLLCGGSRSKLYDTLRTWDGEDFQKMVDTALVSDLLHFINGRYGDVAIVIGDDDDLLPGILTAEAWGADGLFLLRLRPDDNKNLNTNGLIFRLRSFL